MPAMFGWSPLKIFRSAHEQVHIYTFMTLHMHVLVSLALAIVCLLQNLVIGCVSNIEDTRLYPYHYYYTNDVL